MKSSPAFDDEAQRADDSMQWGHSDPPHETCLSKTGNEVIDTHGDVGEYILGHCRVVGIKYDVRNRGDHWEVKLSVPERTRWDGQVLPEIVAIGHGLTGGEWNKKQYPLSSALDRLTGKLIWEPFVSYPPQPKAKKRWGVLLPILTFWCGFLIAVLMATALANSLRGD